MDRLLAVFILGCAALCQLSATGAAAQVGNSQPGPSLGDASVEGGALPLVPRGKSTILGGEIRSVDSVRDQLMLKIMGQRPVKILFDERTQVYRDGSRIPLRELAITDHASVQTVLDGTDVYALSVHLLSRSPQGEFHGQVLNYDPDTHVLTVRSSLSKDPVKLLVPPNTQIARVGQAAISSAHPGSSDLVKDALISVKFESNKEGLGVATEIAVLATPGDEVVFNGNVSSLDIHSGLLTLIDPRDGVSYPVSFDSAILKESKNLHVEDRVSITASFDGTHYTASAIRAN
jgi:hypothetical protein